MSMGNYMSVATLYSLTMAASTPTVGIDHPTVRPANFDPEEESEHEESPDS
jgi:hypothetical protein